jgi:hypothetical protein
MKDGDLIMTGQIKPFSAKNTTADLSSEILFCSVKECSEVASFKCNVNGCRGMQFCTSHGPDHVQHASQSYKDAIDYNTMRGQHNLKLFEEANDRVRNKIQAKIKDEEKKDKMVDEKDEQSSVRTKSKIEEIEDNILKNAKFLKKVEKECRKRSSNYDEKPSHSLPDDVGFEEYEIGSNVRKLR